MSVLNGRRLDRRADFFTPKQDFDVSAGTYVSRVLGSSARSATTVFLEGQTLVDRSPTHSRELLSEEQQEEEMRNFSWCYLPGLFVGLTSSAFAQSTPSNLMVDGSFDTTQPCSGTKRDKSAPAPYIVAAPELIGLSNSDTWEGTPGALLVTIRTQPQYEYYSHVTGASCPWTSPVPAGSTLRVELSAKSLGAPTWLSMSRFWGGGQADIYVTSEWRRFVAYYTVGYDTQGILFSTVPGQVDNLQSLINGDVLIDDVFVRLATDDDYGDMAADGNAQPPPPAPCQAAGAAVDYGAYACCSSTVDASGNCI